MIQRIVTPLHQLASSFAGAWSALWPTLVRLQLEKRAAPSQQHEKMRVGEPPLDAGANQADNHARGPQNERAGHSAQARRWLVQGSEPLGDGGSVGDGSSSRRARLFDEPAERVPR
jgi:hypothetical protein